MARRVLLLAGLTLALVVGFGRGRPVQAATLTVCPSGPPTCQYSSIQAAINAASNGDTIQIAAGTYTGSLTIPGTTSPLTLVGAGSSQTTIQGSGFGSVLMVAAGTVSISNVTITNGDSPTGSGGGIYNSGTLTVSGSVITGNTAGLGGGIYNTPGGTVKLTYSIVSSNTATGGPGSGGGIYNHSGGTVQLTFSIVSSNTPDNCDGTTCSLF